MRAGLVRDQLPDRIESRLDIPLDACQQELHDAGIQAAGIRFNADDACQVA